MKAIEKRSGIYLFPEVLRRARERAGLSQEALADLCGVSQAAVSQWESQRRAVQENTLAKVAGALDLTVSFMLLTELSAIQKGK